MLWTLTALALLAAATEALTVTTYQSERHAMTDARAGADLDAAVVRAVLGISDLRPDRRWRTDGTPRVVAYDGLAIRVAVQDELGRIDLNSASSSLISRLLLGAGVAPGDAATLADRIADWRSKPGPVSLHGASDEDYRAAGLAYLPRHAPFETVDEARLVLGMTPGLFAKIRPALTVYSKRPMFDPATAPREALLALDPADPQKADEIIRSRSGDNGLAASGSASGTPFAAPVGRAYEVTAELAIGSRVFKRRAVIELTGDGKRPYFALAWR